MMRVYFLKTNGYNAVVLSDGKTAKVQHTDASGKIYGVGLYQTNVNGLLDCNKVIDDLRNYFSNLENSGYLENYDSIHSEFPLEEDEAFRIFNGNNPDAHLYLVGDYSSIKYLVRDFDEGYDGCRFYVSDIEKAKKYFSDLLDFCDDEDKKKEYWDCKTLEELRDVLDWLDDDYSYSIKKPQIDEF